MVFIEHLDSVLETFKGKKAIMLCDENTKKLCFSKLNADFPCISISAGEEFKTLESCSYIWDQLIEFEADRNTHLICLGGGMITDLGAYAASCFQRGIQFTLIPTSLLAMVDAAIGGKCGVDYKDLKNYIGLFAEASETIICPDFLMSLPEVEIRNGLMEMLKHGLIADAKHYNEVKRILNQGLKPELNLIKASASIKLQHTEQDYLEKGIRKRLNFGHTLGHGIESLALSEKRELSHGLAVGIGMLGEAYLSHKYWSLTKTELQELIQLLSPLLKEIPEGLLENDKLFKYIIKDKKNRNKQVYFSLLNHIGSAQENIQMDDSQINESIDFLKSLYDPN